MPSLIISLKTFLKKTAASLLIMMLVFSLKPFPLSFAAPFDCNTVADVSIGECEALRALYDATDGENWLDNSNWDTSPAACTWYGVTCDMFNNVYELNLTGNGLNGVLPSEIGDFPSLYGLSIGNNSLS